MLELILYIKSKIVIRVIYYSIELGKFQVDIIQNKIYKSQIQLEYFRKKGKIEIQKFSSSNKKEGREKDREKQKEIEREVKED